MLAWLGKLMGRHRPDETGVTGEDLAADWLRRERAFRIITRNWRSPRDRRDELDLVCRDGEVLVFVEVKARSADALVPGYYAVDRRKRRVLRRAIESYLAGLEHAPRSYRLDVVEVALGPGDAGSEVRHFENVPLCPRHRHG